MTFLDSFLFEEDLRFIQAVNNEVYRDDDAARLRARIDTLFAMHGRRIIQEAAEKAQRALFLAEISARHRYENACVRRGIFTNIRGIKYYNDEAD